MKRRSFLVLAGTTAASVAGLLALAPGSPAARLLDVLRSLSPVDAERKAKVLLAAFPHLDVDPDAARRFIHHHLAHTGGSIHFRLNQETLKRFLLSTDFVQRGGEGRITYMAYYSPWAAACYNPFLLRQMT